MDRKIIEQTREHWRKYNHGELTDLECEQIIQNVTDFFDTLDGWDKQPTKEGEIYGRNANSSKEG